MWLLVALCTASALFAVLSAAFAWRASRASDACTHSEGRLLTMRGRVVGLEGALESLDSKHRKLAARIYADEHHGNRPSPHPVEREIAHVQGACENYARAQVEGPLSAAARCECAYCVAMRAQRDAFRSAAVPKHVVGARVNGDQRE